MNKILLSLLSLICTLLVASISLGVPVKAAPSVAAKQNSQAKSVEKKPMDTHNGTKIERALFAAGCFWKPQYIFSKTAGVVRSRVGYCGGHVDNPNYKQVCTDTTGHAETVQIEFDPTKVTFRQLLETFFANHDPTTTNRQGPDFGSQYRSAIFYTTPEQHAEAVKYKEELEKAHKFGKPIVTVIEPAKQFYDAEEYHQDYFEKHGQVCH